MTTADKTREYISRCLERRSIIHKVQERKGSCIVVTSFFRADGYPVEVEAQLFDNQMVRFTDSGRTLEEVQKRWQTSAHPSLDEVQRIADQYGVHLSRAEFMLLIDGYGGIIQLQKIIAAVLAVSALIEAQREKTQANKTSSGNTGQALLEMFDRISKAHPEPEEYIPPPADGAKNYKHYLYGFPKEE